MRLPIRARTAALAYSPASGRTQISTPVSVGSASRRRRLAGGGGSSRHSKRLGRRHVQFASPQCNALIEITPYEEFYGMHPNCFNFDASGNMVPLSPPGFSPCFSPPPAPHSPTSLDVTPTSTPRCTISLQVQSPSPRPGAKAVSHTISPSASPGAPQKKPVSPQSPVPPDAAAAPVSPAAATQRRPQAPPESPQRPLAARSRKLLTLPTPRAALRSPHQQSLEVLCEAP